MSEDRPDGENPDRLNEPPSFFPQGFNEIDSEPNKTLVEVSVEAVYVREEGASREYFVALRDGERRLAIVIDGCNANAISHPLDGSVPDRPLTHDLMKTVLDRLEAELDRVVIDDLWGTTYYAKLFIKTKSEELHVDARPSDAIALAVRYEAPIFVSESILDNAGEM